MVTAENTGLVAERTANRWAFGIGLAVGFIGLALVLFPARGHLDDLVNQNPFVSPVNTKTVLKLGPDGKPIETEVTTSPESSSILERSFAAGGLLLLRVAVAVTAAFLAGAVVQRMLLGRYEVKLGPVELPNVASEAKSSVEKISTELVAQKADLTAAANANAHALLDLRRQLESLKRATRKAGDANADALVDLRRQLDSLKRASRRAARPTTRAQE